MVWFAQLVLSEPTKGDDSVPLATPLKNDANETHGPWVPCRFSYILQVNNTDTYPFDVSKSEHLDRENHFTAKQEFRPKGAIPIDVNSQF